MSDEMKELLAFVLTSLIGVCGSGLMLGRAIADRDLPWTLVGVADVIVMIVVFGAAFRWFCVRRMWELENIGPLFEEVGD